MASCRDIEQQLAAYVDGDAASIDRGAVDAHLQRCPDCRSRAASERAAHELLCARRAGLRACASDALRQRCIAQRGASAPTRGVLRGRPWVSASLAASLVLAGGLFLLFGWGSTVETYAAQLAADHLKCFQFPPSATIGDVAAIGQAWQAANGWPLKVAPGAKNERLELVGMRRCGSTKGRVAHLMYRWRGEPLSVFVLNDTLEHAPSESGGAHTFESVSRFGERAIIWSNKGQTYALVARGQNPELLQLATYVRRVIE